MRLRLGDLEFVSHIAFRETMVWVRSLQALKLEYQSHLRVAETSLLLHGLIDELHDPVVRVRGESISLFGIESVQRIDEAFNARGFKVLVVKSVAALEHASSHEAEGCAQQHRLCLLAVLTRAQQLATTERIGVGVPRDLLVRVSPGL